MATNFLLLAYKKKEKPQRQNNDQKHLARNFFYKTKQQQNRKLWDKLKSFFLTICGSKQTIKIYTSRLIEI